MTISLTKGQKVEVTKNNPDLKKVIIGLGWDTNKYDGGYDFDLDASAFLLDSNDKCSNESDFIFYNNKQAYGGAILHTGDNLTGAGEAGDDEQIKVDISRVPSYIQKITFTITIHDAGKRGQNFGQVSNAFVRVLDGTTGREILRFDLGEDYSLETAVVVGELYRYGIEWKFNAVGRGFQGGLASLCTHFGLKV